LGSLITTYVYIICEDGNATMLVVGVGLRELLQLFRFFKGQAGVLGAIDCAHVVVSLTKDYAIPE
jgi:hypothetical protein